MILKYIDGTKNILFILFFKKYEKNIKNTNKNSLTRNKLWVIFKKIHFYEIIKSITPS